MRVFQSHFIPTLFRLVQAVEIAVSQPAFARRTKQVKTVQACSDETGIYANELTQFMLRKNQECVVLVQILAELYGELADELGRSFYFLGKEKRKRQERYARKSNFVSVMQDD